MPRTSKWLLKAAASACAAKACKREDTCLPNDVAASEVRENESDNQAAELSIQVTDNGDDECGWDGTVNWVPHSDQGGNELEWQSSKPDSSDSELEVMELEGAELIQSLGFHVEKEQETLTSALSLYERLQRNIPPSQWKKAEQNQHLGYNGLSVRTRQWHKQKAQEQEKKDTVMCQR